MITSEEEISPLVYKHNSSYFHFLYVGILFNSTALDREFINSNWLRNFKISNCGEICSSDENVHKS